MEKREYTDYREAEQIHITFNKNWHMDARCILYGILLILKPIVQRRKIPENLNARNTIEKNCLNFKLVKSCSIMYPADDREYQSYLSLCRSDFFFLFFFVGCSAASCWFCDNGFDMYSYTYKRENIILTSSG